MDYGFTTLADAEAALAKASFSLGAVRLETVKIVGRIRERELYTDLTHPQTGKACSSLDEYLKLKNEELKRITGMGGRHITRHLKAWLCFCEELDFPDDLFLDLGEHLIVLAEAANTGRDLVLRDENAPSPHGGEYLGRQALREAALSIAQGVDAGTWKVKDTRTLVNETLGKHAKPTGLWTLTAYPVYGAEDDPDAEFVRVETLTWTAGDRVFTFATDERWSYEEVRQFAELEHILVQGLGEAFADAHLH